MAETRPSEFIQEAEEAFARAREALTYAESPEVQGLARQAETFQIVQAETNLGMLAAQIATAKMIGNMPVRTGR